MFKRGEKVDYFSNEGNYLGSGTILKSEDWSEYDKNRPSDKWELVLYDDKSTTWTPNKNLKRH